MAYDFLDVAPQDITLGMIVRIQVTFYGEVTDIIDNPPYHRKIQTTLVEGPYAGTGVNQYVDIPVDDTYDPDEWPPLDIRQRFDTLLHRTWWERTGIGSVWFVRADGLLQCEEAAGGDTVGIIAARDTLGALTQVYP
jgi:hypothetical protein